MIVTLDRRAATYAGLLAEHGIDALDATDPASLVQHQGRRVEIILGEPDLIAVAAPRLPRLRWIQSSWAGVEELIAADIPASVTITRAAGIFGTQMREYVMGHLLAHVLRVCERRTATAWDPTPPGVIAGMAMGIMGTGDIGRAIAAGAGSFDMAVRGWSRRGTPRPEFHPVYPADRLLEFAAGLDVLVVALPSTPETARAVDAEVLASLRPGAVFINVGRGATVDTQSVIAALRSGHLSCAVLDVLEREPLTGGDPLWHEPGLTITSHTAAWTRPEDVVRLFVENLGRYERGSELRGVVDRTFGY